MNVDQLAQKMLEEENSGPAADSLRVLMVASEAEPFAKTGGLGDVMGALPRALAGLGCNAAVVIPLYRGTELRAPDVVFDSLTVPLGSAVHFPRILSVQDRGVTVYLVDYPPFFDREGYYGTAAGNYADNAERFMLLSRAAVEIAKLHFRPDVFHCHDWEAAMVPVLLKTVYAGDPALRNTPSVFTIHNLGHPGLFPASVLSTVGLPHTLFTLDGLEFFGHVSYLKGGLIFADHLTTVSEGYAREIQTPEYGHGLHGVVALRKHQLTGILNGVDYSQWDPSTDPFIAARYSAENLAPKRECKRDLLAVMGLPGESIERPLIGMVSRIAVQKGFDLIAAAGDELMRLDLSLVILGTGDPSLETAVSRLQQSHPDKMALQIGYDNALAHKIEAGSDMFLMPSRYEPSGLNQMYSLRYGAVPIVRATGGLDDTVQQFDPSTERGTGFKFAAYTPEAMLRAIREALSTYKNQKLWKAIVRNGMGEDFSWRRSAAKYAALYQTLSPLQEKTQPVRPVSPRPDLLL